MRWKEGILNPNKILILDYKIIKGLIDTPLDFDTSFIQGFSSDVSFDMSFNLEDKLVKADFQVKIASQSNMEQLSESIGEFHFVFIYGIDNLYELAMSGLEDKSIVDSHPDLNNAIASVTYSTIRGILMTRFQGTALESFILPVIDPNAILNFD